MNEDQEFKSSVTSFFIKNADVFNRYSRFYWKNIQKQLQTNDDTKEELSKIQSTLRSDIKTMQENKGNSPKHFINANVNNMNDTIKLIDKLLIKK